MATPNRPLRVCEAVHLTPRLCSTGNIYVRRHQACGCTICIILKRTARSPPIVPYAWKPMLWKTNSVSFTRISNVSWWSTRSFAPSSLKKTIQFLFHDEPTLANWFQGNLAKLATVTTTRVSRSRRVSFVQTPQAGPIDVTNVLEVCVIELRGAQDLTKLRRCASDSFRRV